MDYFWYLTIAKISFNYGFDASGSQLAEPDYCTTYTGPCGFLKDHNYDGFGIDQSLRCQIKQAAGDICGQIFLDTSTYTKVVLSQYKAQVPSHSDFNLGLHIQQDVNGGVAYWVPGASAITNVATSFKAFTGRPPGGSGNDTTAVQDTSPDSGRWIYSADAPGINFTSPILQSLPTGTIIAFRFGARTWTEWGSAIGTPVTKWNFDMTLKKLSAPSTTSPISANVISYGYGSGDTYSPLTVSEAQSY